jgi:hypothetical protein
MLGFILAADINVFCACGYRDKKISLHKHGKGNLSGATFVEKFNLDSP